MIDQPIIVDVKKDDTLYLCKCGKSQNNPYCDGSHDVSENPEVHTAAIDGQLYLCGCGKSSNKPYCDGSHS